MPPAARANRTTRGCDHSSERMLGLSRAWGFEQRDDVVNEHSRRVDGVRLANRDCLVKEPTCIKCRPPIVTEIRSATLRVATGAVSDSQELEGSFTSRFAAAQQPTQLYRASVVRAQGRASRKK